MRPAGLKILLAAAVVGILFAVAGVAVGCAATPAGPPESPLPGVSTTPVATK